MRPLAALAGSAQARARAARAVHDRRHARQRRPRRHVDGGRRVCPILRTIA
ncbi:hypothetical protein [Lysobacter gummosus]|uniref:hypothetical protein n=1 Tax=Lysobacter gummosus TaxID=262324 RepID=UPI00362A04F7